MKKLHETNKGYYLDILEEEEERVLIKVFDMLNTEGKYWFSRYIATRDLMDELKKV